MARGALRYRNHCVPCDLSGSGHRAEALTNDASRRSHCGSLPATPLNSKAPGCSPGGADLLIGAGDHSPQDRCNEGQRGRVDLQPRVEHPAESRATKTCSSVRRTVRGVYGQSVLRTAVKSHFSVGTHPGYTVWREHTVWPRLVAEDSPSQQRGRPCSPSRRLLRDLQRAPSSELMLAIAPNFRFRIPGKNGHHAGDGSDEIRHPARTSELRRGFLRSVCG